MGASWTKTGCVFRAGGDVSVLAFGAMLFLPELVDSSKPLEKFGAFGR